MTKIMKAGQEITSKSVNANIILNEQTRQANELLRQQRIAKVEEDLEVGIGAFTTDTETILARQGKSTLLQNLISKDEQLAEKVDATDVKYTMLKNDGIGTKVLLDNGSYADYAGGAISAVTLYNDVGFNTNGALTQDFVSKELTKVQTIAALAQTVQSQGQWKSDGTIDAAMSTYKACHYNVTGLSYIVVSAIANHSAGNPNYVFLDVNGAVLALGSTTTTTYTNVAIPVPIGAVKFGITLYYTQYTSAVVSSATLAKLKDRVSTLETDMLAKQPAIGDGDIIPSMLADDAKGLLTNGYNVPRTVLQNYQWRLDGTMVASSSTFYAATYDVADLDYLFIENIVLSSNTNENRCSFIWLGAADAPIASPDTFSGGKTITNTAFKVPEGALKLAVTLYYDTYNAAIVRKATLNSYEAEIKSLTNEVDNLFETVSDLMISGLTGLYDDFTIKANTPSILGAETFSGHTWQATGSYPNNIEILDGKITNLAGNFYLFVPFLNFNYMSMKASFIQKAVPPETPSGTPLCVMIFESGSNNLLNFIHLTFSRDSVDVSVRNETNEFIRNYTVMQGNYQYSEIPLGEVFDVSAWIVGNVLFIRKPNGELFILQSNDFTKETKWAKWQITSADLATYKGYIHEVSAGTKDTEKAFRIATKLKALMV